MVATPDQRPIPDPTALTTQQLENAIRNLRELIEARLDGMDHAQTLLEQERNIFPNRIDEKLSAVAGVQNERFRSISVQFAERDVRDERSAKDNKQALDAALIATKESFKAQNDSFAAAVAKNEGHTTKQIDQLAVLIQSTKATLDDKIGDLKDRMILFEGSGQGQKEAKDDSKSTGHYWMAIVGTVVGLFGIAIAVAALFLKK